MQQMSEAPPLSAGGPAQNYDELGAIGATVERLRDDLLDYNPLLAVMADGLQKAIALELEARRCNLLPTGHAT